MSNRKDLYHNNGRNGLNLRFVAWTIGVLCVVQVPFLLITLAISVYNHLDSGADDLSLTILVALLLGIFLFIIGRNKKSQLIGRREAMLTVTLSWVALGVIGMLPFYLGGYTDSIASAFFETISGYTTTGATVFADVESLPKSILFWRSIIQWQGGVGMVVFMVAVIPMVGENAAMIYNSETSGITHERFVPRIGDMAKKVMIIYFGLSVLCCLFLWAGPMTFFDAFCHTCSCIATGGFSTWNNSMAHYNSTYTNVVLIVFMMIGATNFSLFYYVISHKSLKHLLRDSEFQWFMMVFALLSATAVLWLYISGIIPSFGEALERGTFTVSTLLTTTGYSYGDYSIWGGPMAFVILVAMFVAGCTGSTSGGLKIIRLEVLVKSLSNQIRTMLHPRAVIPVRINGHALSSEVISKVMVFFFAYLGIIIVSTLSVSLQGFGITESLSAAISCASNSGGGLGAFGPMYGMASLSAFNKILLAIVMVMGRLEIFTVLVLLYRNFWRG